MKELKIKIYEWCDLKTWFWDQFCFPRRKQVAVWLSYHNQEVRSIVEEYLISCGRLNVCSDVDMELLSKILRSYDKKVNEVTACTTELIMMK